MEILRRRYDCDPQCRRSDGARDVGLRVIGVWGSTSENSHAAHEGIVVNKR